MPSHKIVGVLSWCIPVITQDGLFLVTNNLDLVSGYALAVLTPNVNEYNRLVQKVLSSEVIEVDAPQQLLALAKQGRIGGVTILRKGNFDLISDGDTGCKNSLLWLQDSAINLDLKSYQTSSTVHGSDVASILSLWPVYFGSYNYIVGHVIITVYGNDCA